MIRTPILSWCLVLTLVAAARADIPLPWHQKYIQPSVRFVGIEDYPNQVFFLRFVTFTGGPTGVPHSLIEIKNSEPFNPRFQRRVSGLSLLVMDRSEYDKRIEEDTSLKWLNEQTNGVRPVPLPQPPTVAWILDDFSPVTTYRVEIVDSRPTVETLHSTGSWFQLILGASGAISLVLLGVWLYRRRKSAASRLT